MILTISMVLIEVHQGVVYNQIPYLILMLELDVKVSFAFCFSAAWVKCESCCTVPFLYPPCNLSLHKQGINLLDSLGDATDLLECLNDELPSHELLSILD